ncbi:MAG: hypothetical protein BRD53_05680 [Bacteroidetes bacterium SW_7_64_58]|nr:MAG: hypothetical protein BRD53_05680 [Bacteroidetes bacterium SW_7_64_58]
MLYITSHCNRRRADADLKRFRFLLLLRRSQGPSRLNVHVHLGHHRARAGPLHRRLVTTNWLWTGAWTLRTGLVLWMLGQGL